MVFSYHSVAFGMTHCLHPDDNIFHVISSQEEIIRLLFCGSVVECLAQDQRVAGSSLTSDTALYP